MTTRSARLTRTAATLVAVGLLWTPPHAGAAAPGDAGSALVPSEAHATLRSTDGFRLAVQVVNRSDALGAGPLSGTRGYLCVYADRTTTRGDLVTMVSEIGCANVRDYSYDPTSWTASVAARVPSEISVVVAKRMGSDLRIVSQRRRASSDVVSFTWTGYGTVTPHHAEGVALGYLPGADASLWFSSRARAHGRVTMGGLQRRFDGVNQVAAMTTGGAGGG